MTEEEFKTGKGEAFAERDPYIEACDKVCSPDYHADNVDVSDFLRLLDDMANLGEAVNLRKKILFRGKRPDEVGMFYPSPGNELYQRVGDENADLVHGVVGAITEVGELAEQLAKHIRGQPIDRVNVVEETGDITWYLSRVLKWAGVTFNHCFKVNVDKLYGRHGETFNFERDHNRDLDAERAKLEAGVELPLLEPRTSDMADLSDATKGVK
ncbi:hypothetical protein [Sphingomonas phage Kimi]|nr:hypothetical protein [Sphingomonas phage Kimi]